jgi:hypothetical protein
LTLVDDLQPTTVARIKTGTFGRSGVLDFRRGRRLPVGWDHFAHRCGGSYHGSKAYIDANRLTHRVAIFEFSFGGEKVAQCAIGSPRFGKQFIFLDTLQVLPKAAQHWSAMMQIILRSLGPGRYRYGSSWTTLAGRHDDLQALIGVTVLHAEHYYVQAVDFAMWPDWQSYFRAISTNAKRNAAKALKTDPQVGIEWLTGLNALRRSRQMITMRQNMFHRKKVRWLFSEWSAQLLRRVVMLRSYGVTAWVRHQERLTAFAFGVRFGDKFYYTDGASVQGNGGSAWYLLIELLRRTQQEHPQGQFVMGYNPVIPFSDVEGWSNVLRQREQCKVRNFPTSVVKFVFA